MVEGDISTYSKIVIILTGKCIIKVMTEEVETNTDACGA